LLCREKLEHLWAGVAGGEGGFVGVGGWHSLHFRRSPAVATCRAIRSWGGPFRGACG
jgi:hypothetical protein